MGMLMLAACGRDALKPDRTHTTTSTETETGTGTKTSTGTGTKTSRITPRGNCAKLTCLDDFADLMTSCPLSGTCVTQQLGMSVNICYSNGVKMSAVISSTDSLLMSLTVKNGSKTCYTGQVDETSYVLKNTSGKQVATLDLTGYTMDEFPITCPDDTTGTLDSSCGAEVTSAISATGMNGECTDGTCKF
jgi:hypothetical protein